MLAVYSCCPFSQSARYPRGRVLGGSSAVNFLMYVRGNRRDYDRWAALGNPGWDYESVLPFFKKMENYKGAVTNETSK